MAIARLAARQHGVVNGAQLRDIGLAASTVAARLKTGRLHLLHRGVYAVGHSVLTKHGVYMAAVLAAGPQALLSHRSAAGLHGLLSDNRGRVDVTVARGRHHSRPGFVPHRSRTLAAVDRTAVDGIPVTSVARTLVDLADVADRRTLERACQQAEFQRILFVREVEAALRRARGRHGAPLLRRVLAEVIGSDPELVHEGLEERFLALCQEHGIPRPQSNVYVRVDGGDPLQVDFLWEAERLVVETDGLTAHGTKHAFETDRRRDQRLILAGYRVVRFTYKQVVYDPATVVATLMRLLGGTRLA